MSRSTELVNRPSPTEQALEMAKGEADALLQVRGPSVVETNPEALNGMVRTLVALQMKLSKNNGHHAGDPE